MSINVLLYNTLGFWARFFYFLKELIKKYCPHYTQNNYDLEVIKRTCLLVDPWAGPRRLGAPRLLPCTWSLQASHTVDSDYRHEIKRYLLLGKIDMTNLDDMLKFRDITLPTKVHIFKAMVFPAVMHGCESWTVKKAEHRRIDAFELWCWKRSWESPGLQGDPTSQSYRKSTLNILWKDWCWNWNSNTLATWCEEPTHWKRTWCWERLRAGGGGSRGWDG